MKLIKTLMIAGVITLLVAGSALAWGGPAGNGLGNFSKSELSLEERQELRLTKEDCITYENLGERLPLINVVAEITGKTVEEVQELCQQLREDDKTILDYLKEENLLDDVKEAMIEKAQEILDTLLEEGKITEEQYNNRLEQLTEKINDENFFAIRNTIRNRVKNFYRNKVNGQKIYFNNALELTGLTAEEFRALCLELREEGKTLTDYLKEEGLYDEWKQNLLDKYEERLQPAIENGKITEERASEILTQYEEKLENGTPLNRGNSFNTMKGKMNSNNGRGRGGNRGSNQKMNTGKTY